MHYTLGDAARSTGLSKPTIQRAIKSGKLSATRNEDGSYSIDPAELHRVYGTLPRDGNDVPPVKQDETPSAPNALQVEVEVLRQKLSTLDIERERERQQLSDRIEDLRNERDRLIRLTEEATISVRMITDQSQKPEPQPMPRRGILSLFGRRGV